MPPPYCWGATLVTVPSSSAVIIASLRLDPGRYGSVFMAQLVGALVCGVGLAALGRRVSLHATLLLAIACLAGAQALLAISQFVAPATGYLMLMAVMLLVGGGHRHRRRPAQRLPGAALPSLPGLRGDGGARCRRGRDDDVPTLPCADRKPWPLGRRAARPCRIRRNDPDRCCISPASAGGTG
ncbi:hypothetical protein ACFSTD_22255 [Novosphingobium colocasiae]